MAKAIREFLRYAYAPWLTGDEPEPVPLKISAYSGKGVGHYATAPDGRADWSPEFKRYIERSEARKPESRDLEFGVGEVHRAMEALKAREPAWWDLLRAIDVEGTHKPDEYATDAKMDLSTVKRQRKKATFLLYGMLRLTPAHAQPERVAVKTVPA